MRKWPNKDIYEFNSFLKLQSFANPGTTVLQEGITDDSFVIVWSGMFEIVKNNFRDVY